jgi:hypothetical protein
MSETLDIGTLMAKLGIDTSGVDKAGDSVKEFADNAEKEFDKAGESALSFAETLKVIAGAAALSAATAAVNDFVQTASDLEEVGSKFSVVFRGVEGTTGWVGNLQKDFAMSEREARFYLSSIQDLLVPMGMARDKAAGLSNEIVKLGTDLGSFNNMPTADVMADIQSALVGEYDTMKKYGVILTATAVQQKALNMGFADKASKLTAAQKALAAYSIMVSNSGDAIGDMKRTQDSFANSLKATQADWENVKAEIGQGFMPIAKELLIMLQDLIASFKVNQEEISTFVSGLVTLAEVVGTGAAIWLLPELFVVATAKITAASIATKKFIADMTMLQKSASVLFAAFAGWKIGEWLYKEFETARLAGLAMIDGLMSGWLQFNYYCESLWLGLRGTWEEMLGGMQSGFAWFIDTVSSGLESVPFAEDSAAQLSAYASELKAGVKDVNTFADAQYKLKQEFNASMATHKKYIEEMRKDVTSPTFGKKVSTPSTADADDLKKRMEEMKKVMDAAGASMGAGKFDPKQTGAAAKAAAKAAKERIKIEKSLTAELNELTMERLDYFDWETKQELSILAKKYGEQSAIYKKASAVRLEERKKLVEELSQIEAARVEKETATLEKEAEKRNAIMEDMKLRSIEASQDEFEVRRYNLEVEGKLFAEKYANDAELMAMWNQTFNAEMGKIDADYAEHMENQKSQTRSFSDELQNAWGNLGNDFAGQLTNMVMGSETSFKEIGASFAEMITQMLIKQALLKAFSSTGMGSFFGAMHSGGVVGLTGGSSLRKVNPAVFMGAPRLHDGLAGDEFPAILQKGETVIPRGAYKNTAYEPAQTQQAPDIQIMNAFDPKVVEGYLASSKGKKAIKNIISSDRYFVRGLGRG